MDIINEWNVAVKSYSESGSTSIYSDFCKEFVSNHFANIQDLKIFDAGCGNGDYTHILSNKGFVFYKMYEPIIYEDRKIPDIPLYLFAEFKKILN